LIDTELVPARLILKTFNNNWFLGALMFIEAVIMLSFAFIADFFAVAHVATKASNVAMSGDYEEAKRIIETL
jgi:hypothetical protein